MKKILSTILCVIMLLSALPVFTWAEDNKNVIYTPYSIMNINGTAASKITKTLESEDGISYVRLKANAGNLGPMDGYLKIIFENIKLFDYPYIRIDYRTDSPQGKIDTSIRHKGGENWCASHPVAENDGKWHTAIKDANEISDPASVSVNHNEEDIALWIKPWNGGNTVNLSTNSYFDIRFVGAFKSEADAKAFKYSEAYNEEVVNFYEGDTGFINPEGEEALAKFNAEFEAEKERILNTETNVTVTGTKYYVSMTGSDDNDGLSPETPWQTLAHVKKQKFNPGDGVFFKRGDHFRANGTQIILQSGVTYSAYGEGEKPVFVGSTDASDPKNWIQTDTKNIYKFRYTTNDAGCLVFDGGRAWGVIVRNSGGTSIDRGVVHNGIDEPYKSGGEPYKGYKSLKNNLEFTNYENRVHVYSKDGNPAEVFDSVEIMWNLTAIGGGNFENVVFDNIKLFGYGAHGIATGNVKNFTVQNCVFGWIGGSGHPLGNAVQNWENADGFKIDSCYTYQAYDCAYTTQLTTDSSNANVYIKNVEFSNNLAEYVNTGLEVWNAADKTAGTPIHYENVKLHNNMVRNVGYGWSHQRPNKDGNFYYGAFFGTMPSWDDYKVYDNKFAVTYAYGLLSRFISPENSHFDKNLYIMQKDRVFARSAENYMTGYGLPFDYAYKDRQLEKLTADGIEANGSFYYLEKDYVPEPFDYAEADDIYFTHKFTDVGNHWAKKEIEHAIYKGWYNGVSETKFAPNDTMTRAMFLTVLSRIEGAKLTTGAKWYDGAMNWAVEKKLIASDDLRPDDNITRSEMAVIVAKMLNEKGAAPAGSGDFSDADKYGADVLTALKTCAAAGILKGYEDNSFRGEKNSTRAEVATVFCRYENFLAK